MRSFLYRPGRGRGVWRQKKSPVLFPALAGIMLALILLVRVDAVLRPQLTEMAAVQVRAQMTELVNRALLQTMEEETLSPEGLVTVRAGADGNIQALSVNAPAANRLRGALLARLSGELARTEWDAVSLPLGNLSGLLSLSGCGPAVTAPVRSVSAPQAELRSEFSGAGVNQTIHRLMLDVTVSVRLMLPGGSVPCEVTASVCAAETVLLGQVPETYVSVRPGAPE